MPQKLLEKLRPLFRIFLRNYMPRWIIFGIDLAIVTSAFISLWFFRETIAEGTTGWFTYKLILVLALYASTAAIFKTYRGIVRFSSLKDLHKLSVSAFTATALFFGFSILFNHLDFNRLDLNYLNPTNGRPFTAFQTWFPIILGFMVVAGQLMFRFAVRATFELLESSGYTHKKERCFVLGIDTETVKITNELLGDRSTKYKPVAFLTLENGQANKNVCGLPIEHVNGNLPQISEKYNAKALLVTRRQLDAVPRAFYDKCIVDGIDIYLVNTISPFSPVTWQQTGQQVTPHKGAEPEGRETQPPKINKIKIEDLLGRNVIEINKDAIRPAFEGESILITGAAGSIGSEIARQVVQFNCKRVILVDQAESPLNDLWLELQALGTNVEIKPVVANVTHKERMRQVFDCAKPAVVFHAAAYKHVPMMEIHPSTAVVTNVLGTKICADLAAETGVGRFVMISTDKAVNPTNVMGATKRAAEIYIQSLALHTQTKFITTRFGNVLGSNGSVVPLFKRQIEKGGPVTVTHRDITRFFMTIPEACSLVLEAGCTGHGGEIYVFDMGEAVKIYELAEKMIRLSGKIPGKDIQIVETGLRPGEKLYEELLATTEDTIPTYNKKIMIAKVRRYKYEFIGPTIEELLDTAIHYDLSREVVWRLKLLIPEFKSQNSDYCHIDREIDTHTDLNEAYAQYEVHPLPPHILKNVQKQQQQIVQA
jgi:FlaA1/EpsC-like NDP-sugar epimerase